MLCKRDLVRRSFAQVALPLRSLGWPVFHFKTATSPLFLVAAALAFLRAGLPLLEASPPSPCLLHRDPLLKASQFHVGGREGPAVHGLKSWFLRRPDQRAVAIAVVASSACRVRLRSPDRGRSARMELPSALSPSPVALPNKAMCRVWGERFLLEKKRRRKRAVVQIVPWQRERRSPPLSGTCRRPEARHCRRISKLSCRCCVAEAQR